MTTDSRIISSQNWTTYSDVSPLCQALERDLNCQPLMKIDTFKHNWNVQQLTQSSQTLHSGTTGCEKFFYENQNCLIVTKNQYVSWSLCLSGCLTQGHMLFLFSSHSLSSLSCLPGRSSLWAPAFGPHTWPAYHQLLLTDLVSCHYLRWWLWASHC